MTDVELQPCPFCGAPAERIDFGPGDAENEGGSCISCTQCQSSGPLEFGYKENFISNWNRRARTNVAHATAAKDAEIEALRAEVERLTSLTAVTMGVGRGDGSLFVHGDYESIKAAQALVFRAERLAEVLSERRDWFDAQAKLIGNGSGSSWDLMQVREQRDLCDAALEQENDDA